MEKRGAEQKERKRERKSKKFSLESGCLLAAVMMLAEELEGKEGLLVLQKADFVDAVEADVGQRLPEIL